MGLFQLIAILLALTALCSYINYRYVHLHTTIGVMLLALLLSLALVVLGDLGLAPGIKNFAHRLLAHVDFHEALLQWMLGFLLFAGALHVDLGELSRQRSAVALLAVVGTIASMFIVAGLSWVALRGIGLSLPRMYCMIFGALISPTDPVAVIAIMKSAGAPKDIETKLAGESLFNDGLGVVLFLMLVGAAGSGQSVAIMPMIWAFLRQVIGGALVGFIAGTVVYQFLKRVDNYQVEILLTLALAMGAYAIAGALDTSAPIAAVVSGLLIGNQGRAFAMSNTTRQNLDTFWELIDEILNAVLFLLIGLEVLVLPFTRRHLLAVALVIPIVLLARLISVGGCIGLLSLRRRFKRSTVTILTWGGLRGGLAVAMALSLPPSPWRNTIIAVTYGVVIFSIVVQGTTIKPLVRRLLTAPGG